MANFNQPQMRDANGNPTVRRYVHSPLTINHHGLQASIQPTGKVILRGIPTPITGTDEVEYDEIEVPASFIFDIAKGLQLTRNVENVSLSEVKKS